MSKLSIYIKNDKKSNPLIKFLYSYLIIEISTRYYIEVYKIYEVY